MNLLINFQMAEKNNSLSLDKIYAEIISITIFYFTFL